MKEHSKIINQFTTREWDVFNLLIEGHTNKVVAAELGISPKTVEAHRANIMRKSGARGLADLIALGKAAQSFI